MGEGRRNRFDWLSRGNLEYLWRSSLRNQRELKILFIDQPAHSSLLCSFLEQKGLQVHTCSGAQEGFDFLDKEEIDLIVLNLILEHGISGYEMCQQLKENPKTQGIPIILLCNTRLPREIERAHRNELQTDDLFSKPVDPGELYRAIKRLIAPSLGAC